MAVAGGGVLITYKSAMAKSAAERVTRVGVGIWGSRRLNGICFGGEKKWDIVHAAAALCREGPPRIQQL